MTQSQEKQKIQGKLPAVLSSIVLIWVWYTLFSIFIVNKSPILNLISVNISLFEWIRFGPLPLLMFICLYYFTRSNWAEPKQNRDFAGLKGMIAGFFLWAVFIIILQLQQITDDHYTIYLILGGFLVMLGFAMAFQGRIRLAKS